MFPICCNILYFIRELIFTVPTKNLSVLFKNFLHLTHGYICKKFFGQFISEDLIISLLSTFLHFLHALFNYAYFIDFNIYIRKYINWSILLMCDVKASRNMNLMCCVKYYCTETDFNS